MVLLVLASLLCVAKADEEYYEIYKESGLSELEDTLSDEVKSVLEELEIDPSNLEGWQPAEPQKLWDIVCSFFAKRIKRPIASLCSSLTIVLIYAIIGSLKGEEGSVASAYAFVCSLSAAACFLMPMMSAVRETIDVIDSAGKLMLGFIPVFCMILVSSGRISTALAYEGVLLFICEGVSSVCSFFISPFVGAYICLGMSAAISENEGIYKLSVSIKNAATWILGFLMTIFTGFLGAQSVISKSADNVYMKTTRFFVGSTIPIVGGAISEALSTVTAGVGMLRSSAMIWCIVAVAIIMLPIVLELFFWRIALSVMSSISSMFCVPSSEKVFSIAGIAVGFLIALLLSVLCMFIISLLMVGGGS